MASNVFGTPVTNETLEGLPEYHKKKPTQVDRARVALEMKNAEGKDLNARKFVELLQQRYGEGENCVAMCVIYNATGNPLTFSDHYSWNGRVGESPMPARLENGQWGAFVYGKWGSEEHSIAAVVYSGKLPNDIIRDWLLCWSTASTGPANQVYTDIGEPGHFKDKWDNDITGKLSSNPYYSITNSGGAYLFGSIGNSTTCVVEGIFSLYDAWFA